MISTLSIWNDLAPLFGFLGATGLVTAVLAAATAGAAGALNRADAVGVSTGVWLAGVLLSTSASYAGGWWVIGVALAAYPVALVIGALTRYVTLHTAAGVKVRRFVAARTEATGSGRLAALRWQIRR